VVLADSLVRKAEASAYRFQKQKIAKGDREMQTSNGLEPATQHTERKVVGSLSPEEKLTILAKFKEPFNPRDINWVVKATGAGRRGKQGLVLPYADCRVYTARLDEVVTSAGWTDEYSVQVVEGFDRRRKGAEKPIASAKVLVVCRLTLFGLGAHSGTGECWADDENVLTSADAQAFKRACSDFGIGRYLYDIPGQWVDLDDNERPTFTPRLPDWAIPVHLRAEVEDGTEWERGNKPVQRENVAGEKTATATKAGGASLKGPKAEVSGSAHDDEQVREICGLATEVGNRLAASVVLAVRGMPLDKGEKLRFMPMQELLAKSDRGERTVIREKLTIVKRGVDRLKAAVGKVGLKAYTKVCEEFDCPGGISDVPDVKTLAKIVQKLEEITAKKAETKNDVAGKNSVATSSDTDQPSPAGKQQELELPHKPKGN
jgi:hypothetical protein